MEAVQAASVPLIATIVYWVVNLVGHAIKKKDTFMRFQPLLSFSLGAGIGIFMYYITPDVNAAGDVLTAFIGGGTSGLSGSGFTAMFKSFKKPQPAGQQVVAVIQNPTAPVDTANAPQNNITVPLTQAPTPNTQPTIAIIQVPTETE
ncbi:MAG: hypothetical protein R3Y23_06950 [Bacillota bacterium]